jgi:hypothetical protein
MADTNNPLLPSKADRIASTARAILGAAPYIGGLLAEIATELIPGQRIERLTAFVGELDARLRDLNEDRLRERLASPEGIHLLEAAASHAAKSASAERSAQFAAVLAEGIKADKLDMYAVQHMLSLLAEINDAELILLKGIGLPLREQTAFAAKHPALLRARRPIGKASDAEQLQYAVIESYKDHLQRLGLIAPYFSPWRSGEPKFDSKTGTLMPQSIGISPLGKALLALIEPTAAGAG